MSVDLIRQIVDHVVGETLIGGRKSGAMVADGETAGSIEQFKTLLAEKLRTAGGSPGSSSGTSYLVANANGLQTNSPAPNSDSGVGIEFDTDNTLSSVDSLLAKWSNGGVPLIFIGHKGGILIGKVVLSSGWDNGDFSGITILRDFSQGETLGAAIDIAATEDFDVKSIFAQISSSVKTTGSFKTLQFRNPTYEQTFDVYSGPDNGDQIYAELRHFEAAVHKYFKITVDNNGAAILYKSGAVNVLTMDVDGNIYSVGNIECDGVLYGSTSISTDGFVAAQAYKAGGQDGVDGSFTSLDGKTITVTKGIITAITP